MISSVHPIVAPVAPIEWEDVEVVDSVLVAEPAPGRAGATESCAAASVYDGSGRVALEGRFGRLVSVLA